MKKILVTGFDPFGGEKVNPALEVIKLLPKKIGENEVRILEIPTVYKKSVEKIEKEIESYRPDYVLSIGQAGGRASISIERVAINIDDFRIKDNEGNQPIDENIFEDGENAYFSTLPIKSIQEELSKNNIPSSISNTAGTFVCNHLMYGVLYTLAKKYPHIKGGFTHVPFIPAQVARRTPVAPYMALEDIKRGLEAAIAAIDKNFDADINVNGGKEF